MKPVVICRFAPHEGPGYFATYLERHGIPWRIAKIGEGARLPRPESISGLALMGGPMSANDDLSWIPPTLALIRECMALDKPVIGHCLGGQLMSRAIGGEVRPNAVKEIGWGVVQALDTPAAKAWGTPESFLSFHWHGETFSIPDGAERIWSSAHCPNQAFSVGRHLAMQCHIEMTADLIDCWCATGAAEIAESLDASPAVQAPEAIRDAAPSGLEALNRVADLVYDRWTAGLNRGNS